ncbi:MAG TPA: hypothetical protein PKC43_04945 [Phycisphaerales bacterium]|nr:hypothetical protein [Phycisphaerales bacterium]HMP36776.1 hypothetical protein [Phycisphaerales bacterium]
MHPDTLRRRGSGALAAALALAATSLATAELVTWTGAADRIWEKKENWSPKKVPGPADDVLIPKHSGEIMITVGNTLVGGNPVPAPKKLKSLTLEGSTDEKRATILTAAQTQPGMPAPTKHLPVNIVIETTGDIEIGKVNTLLGANAKGSPTLAIAGGSVVLKTTGENASIRLVGEPDIRAGHGGGGFAANGQPFLRGAGGSVELRAKGDLTIVGAEVFAASDGGFWGTGSAPGGSVVIQGKKITLKDFAHVRAGLSTSGLAGSVTVDSKSDLSCDATSVIKGGTAILSGTVGGGVGIVALGKVESVGEIAGGDGETGGNVVLFADDLDNPGVIAGGKSNAAGTKGGDVTLTVKKAPPTKVGKPSGGEGTPAGDVLVNGKKLMTFTDPIRGGRVLVKVTGEEGEPPIIAFLEGGSIEAETFVCLDAAEGSIDFSGFGGEGPAIAVLPSGLVNLGGSPVLGELPSLASLIEGDFIESDGGCTPRECLADIDGDGVVDEWDLALLLAFWGAESAALDFDGDGAVGSGDLSLLLAAWGPCD